MTRLLLAHPQGNAKELYLVTDADFKKLGSVAKANPKHKDWTPMRLYLESQVLDITFTSTGSFHARITPSLTNCVLKTEAGA